MAGFTSLQAAVTNMGGTIVQRSRLTFAPLVLKTLASFTNEDGTPDGTMLALVATNVPACETLYGTLDDDAQGKVILLDAGKVTNTAGEPVTFAALRSHVANTCKTRKVIVNTEVIRGSDDEPIGFTVRKVTN